MAAVSSAAQPTTSSSNWFSNLLYGGMEGKNKVGGLFGMGGKFDLGQSMMTAGMGLGAAQAFGSSSGSPYPYLVRLSPAGKRVEKAYYETTKKQYEGSLLPPNLASIYVGKIKRQEGTRRRQARRGMGGYLTGLPTGRAVGASLAETGTAMEGGVAPTRWRGERKIQDRLGAYSHMSNIISEQLQLGQLQTAQGYYKTLASDWDRARRGQALGDVAQYLAMMRYPT